MRGQGKRVVRLLRRRWPVVVFLAACLLFRILLFRGIVPGIHTDSVTYLVLEDMKPIRTPGYPLFIEMVQALNDIFSLTPRYLYLIVIVQMLGLGVLNSYLIYRLARILSRNEGFAFFLGVIYNLDYFVIGFEFLILTETLSLTLLSLTLLFYLKIFQGGKTAAYLAGLFSGCLTLTRPSFAALFLFLVSVSTLVYFRREGHDRGIKPWVQPLAIFILLNLVAILGWSFWNKIKHDYFGLSTILPFALGYFTQNFYWKYKPGSDPELNKLTEIIMAEKGQPSRVTWRLIEDWKLSEVEIARLLLRFNLKLIRENPVDYLKLLPRAADHYYRYSWYWTESQNARVFKRQGFLLPPLQFFSRLYALLFKNTWVLVLTVLVIPLAFLVASRKNQEIFHVLCLVEVTVHSNFIISILFSPGGINNLRYRQPVEPLILLVLYGALFFFIRNLTHSRRRSPVLSIRASGGKEAARFR